MAGIFCVAVLLIAEVPSGTISSAMPLKRFSVTRVAITGVMRSFMTMKPLSSAHPDPHHQRDQEGGEEGETVQDRQAEHHRGQAHRAADREIDVAGDHQQGERAAQNQDRRGDTQHVDHAVRAQEGAAAEQTDLADLDQAEDHNDHQQDHVNIVLLDGRPRGVGPITGSCGLAHRCLSCHDCLPCLDPLAPYDSVSVLESRL